MRLLCGLQRLNRSAEPSGAACRRGEPADVPGDHTNAEVDPGDRGRTGTRRQETSCSSFGDALGRMGSLAAAGQRVGDLPSNTPYHTIKAGSCASFSSAVFTRGGTTPRRWPAGAALLSRTPLACRWPFPASHRLSRVAAPDQGGACCRRRGADASCSESHYGGICRRPHAGDWPHDPCYRNALRCRKGPCRRSRRTTGAISRGCPRAPAGTEPGSAIGA